MKMADIDIEEHDLLENPILKIIFPDLSILKKEIVNFTEEFNYGTINSEGDLNTITASNTTSSCKKKNLIGHIKKKRIIKNSIVILNNISPFLKKSKRFCQTCLILFPDNCSLDAHNKFFHFNTNDFKDNLKNDVIKSDSTDKKVCSSSVISDRKVVAITHKTKSPIVSMNNSLKLCVHCDVLFSSKELIDHLYDVLITKKKIQGVKRLNHPYTNVKNKQCKNDYVILKETFYCCPICSYYFDSRNIYSQHLLVNHHASIKVTSLPGCFSPICKFCYIRCSNKVSYNIHLHLSHKEEINKKLNLKGYFSQDIYTSHKNSHEFVNITDSLPKDNTVVGYNIAEEDQNMDTATHNDDITHLEKASIFTCINCNVSMNVYDEAIGHCHMHSDCNNLHLDSIECATCKLNFVVASYDAHQDLHVSWSKDQFKQFTFDVLYFGSKNDTWIKLVFGSLRTGSIDRFIENSIYKDEYRLKLEVTQQGLAHLTIYKCDNCQSFVESHFIYKHMASCTNSKKFSCKFCNLPFVSSVSRKRHEDIHTNCIIDPKSYRIVTFNREEDKSLNKKLANIKKYHVLYQCRFCCINFVDKRIYDRHKCYGKEDMASSTTKLYSSSSNLKIVKIFKCLCGLHFLNETTIREHSKGCSGKIKIKQSKQNCLKCGLTFSNDILFQHLLKHHKGKNVSFEYDIVEI